MSERSEICAHREVIGLGLCVLLLFANACAPATTRQVSAPPERRAYLKIREEVLVRQSPSPYLDDYCNLQICDLDGLGPPAKKRLRWRRGVREINAKGNDVTSGEAIELSPGRHSVIVERGISCRYGSSTGGYAGAILSPFTLGFGAIGSVIYHATTDSQTLRMDFEVEPGKSYFVICPKTGNPWAQMVDQEEL